MRYYEIEKEMYQRAVQLIETRQPVGWSGAGVVHTSNENYYTSVSIETANGLQSYVLSWEPCLKRTN